MPSKYTDLSACLVCFLILGSAGCNPQEATGEPAAPTAADEKPPAVRKFAFWYAGAVTGLEPGAKARIWLPVAESNHEQKVERFAMKLPGEFRETREKKFGNALLYFEAEADGDGRIPLSVEYHVERKELRASEAEAAEAEELKKFLAADRLVPIDRALTSLLLGEQRPEGDSLAVARKIYDSVEGHMSYGKPDDKPWGRGDSRYACDVGVGNCTDFHSLFISLARDLGTAAKFEIGFPLPPEQEEGEIGGYHCWAKFHAEGRWVPVDISEADKFPELKEYYFGNLTADRVTFSQGRDLELEPGQAGDPVNFLVYPYVEVDARPHTGFEKQFRFKDLP